MKSTFGVKRKRPDDGQSEEDKEAKLRRKLHHSLRELRKVVKKAKTFEVQKTLKKRKDARRNDPESDMYRDLGIQMEMLKCLNHDQLARSALVTKLKKDKILFSEQSIQAISAELASNLVSPGTPGTPMAKVQSRILSSKVLASEVTSMMDTLKAFLHPSVGSEDAGKATHDSDVSLNISRKQRTSKVSVGIASSEGSGGEDEDSTSDHDVAETSDGWESGTVGEPSGSEDSDGEGDAISEYQQSRPNGSKGQSQFLPSLSVGFTRGDSGSEISDSELKLVDGSRKNRRGQRARRAIWEKKFGNNANHVKKKEEQAAPKRRPPGSIPADRNAEMGNSSSRRSTAPSRTPTRRLKPVRGYQNTKDSASKQKQSGRLEYQGDFRKHQERPLHPSWEAKRKQRMAGMVPSQGTKIVFSDS
ncbi:Bud-site selection protein [Chiua virens]|nr:Bud-site selection protein [Chiua virens]